MESTGQKIQFIAELYFRVCDFSNFCSDAHFYSRCIKSPCKYKRFSSDLLVSLQRIDRTEDEKRFFSLCTV